MLPAKDVEEFQTILKEEYGRELTEGEAGVLALRLLLLYEVIYQKRPGNETKPLEDSLESHTARCASETGRGRPGISDPVCSKGFEYRPRLPVSSHDATKATRACI